MTTLITSLLLLSSPAVSVQGTVQSPSGSALKDAVVWLDGGAKGSPLKGAKLDQRRRTFIPHVLVVTKGTKVDFPNNDTVYHNVFAEFEAQKFDLGMYPRGAKKSQVFDKVGVTALFCHIHSEMNAYVLTVDSAHFAKTDANGKFRLEDVPLGSYTIRGWHESGVSYSASTSIASQIGNLTIRMKR